jgi:hypothetical protein
MLANCAAWISEEAAAFSLPIARLDAQQAQGTGRGVCQHIDLGSWGGGHVDCGPGFPMDEVLFMAGAGSPPPPMSTTEEGHNMIAVDENTGGVWVAKADGAVITYDGAPYYGGSNMPDNRGKPCVGIAALPGGGYVTVHEWGLDDYRRYHFRP